LCGCRCAARNWASLRALPDLRTVLRPVRVRSGGSCYTCWRNVTFEPTLLDRLSRTGDLAREHMEPFAASRIDSREGRTYNEHRIEIGRCGRRISTVIFLGFGRIRDSIRRSTSWQRRLVSRLASNACISGRVERALGGRALHAFPVNLGRLAAGAAGVIARTSGRQDDIQDFYRELVRLLEPSGIAPLYRKSGLHPHMTLGYAPCRQMLRSMSLTWYPDELLLIESEHGLTRHNVLGRWALLPPRQPLLPFGEATAATSPARRSAA